MRTSDLELVAGDVSWVAVAANTQALAGRGYFMDVSTSAYTVTLPSSPTLGDSVVVSDVSSNSSGNNITVARNGENIQGAASNYVIKLDGDCVQFVYHNSSYGWQVVSKLKYPSVGPGDFYFAYGYTNTGSLSTNCYSFDGSSWFTETSGPTPARQQCGGSALSSIYVYGGYSTSTLTDCDSYDASSWSSETSMGTATRFMGGSTLGDSVYSLAGYQTGAVQSVYSYDGSSWTTETSMPTPARYRPGGFTISSYTYSGGGYNGSANIADCDRYDGSSWSSVTDIPSPARRDPVGTEVDSRGYLSGGISTAATAAHTGFDGSSWTTYTNMATARAGANGYRLADDACIAGGTDGSGNVLNSCETFNGTNWTTESVMPGRRTDAAAGGL